MQPVLLKGLPEREWWFERARQPGCKTKAQTVWPAPSSMINPASVRVGEMGLDWSNDFKERDSRERVLPDSEDEVFQGFEQFTRRC
jgi:hypothetical protein